MFIMTDCIVLCWPSTCSNNDLEAVGMSLSLLKELSSSQSMVNEHGYTPQLLMENRMGHPRLDVKQEQLEYLLHLGFSGQRLQKFLVLA